MTIEALPSAKDDLLLVDERGDVLRLALTSGSVTCPRPNQSAEPAPWVWGVPAGALRLETGLLISTVSYGGGNWYVPDDPSVSAEPLEAMEMYWSAGAADTVWSGGYKDVRLLHPADLKSGPVIPLPTGARVIAPDGRGALVITTGDEYQTLAANGTLARLWSGSGLTAVNADTLVGLVCETEDPCRWVVVDRTSGDVGEAGVAPDAFSVARDATQFVALSPDGTLLATPTLEGDLAFSKTALDGPMVVDLRTGSAVSSSPAASGRCPHETWSGRRTDPSCSGSMVKDICGHGRRWTPDHRGAGGRSPPAAPQRRRRPLTHRPGKRRPTALRAVLNRKFGTSPASDTRRSRRSFVRGHENVVTPLSARLRATDRVATYVRPGDGSSSCTTLRPRAATGSIAVTLRRCRESRSGAAAIAAASPVQAGTSASTSGGCLAWFEDDDGRLDRPQTGIAIEPLVDFGPPLPQSITLGPRGREGVDGARRLARQTNDGIGVRLEVEPPGGMALVPAVHRQHDEVRAVFDVADDDASSLPGLAPDGGEAQRTPAALVRRGPQEAPAAEPVQHRCPRQNRCMNHAGGSFRARVSVVVMAVPPIQERTRLQPHRMPQWRERAEGHDVETGLSNPINEGASYPPSPPAASSLHRLPTISSPSIAAPAPSTPPQLGHNRCPAPRVGVPRPTSTRQRAGRTQR